MVESKARVYGYDILINIFEQQLRSFLANEILTIGYGRKWLEGIPTGIIDIAKERSNNNSFENPLELLGYTDFIHLKEIAIYSDNFNYCKDFFGDITKKKLIENMDELYSLRNKIAHVDRNFSLLDLEILIEILLEILNGDLSLTIRDYIEKEDYRDSGRIPSDFLIEESTVEVFSNLPSEDYDLEGGFVGRKEDKRKLLSLLYSDLDRVITVTGSGGVGKTALALNIAYKIREDPKLRFHSIIWFSAKTTKLTPESIIGIVPQIRSFEELIKKTFSIFHSENQTLFDTLGSIEKAAEYLKRTFSETPVLLIIDNLETVLQDNDLIEFLKDVPHPSKVLITSRFGLGEVERRFPLKELSLSEACHLFRLICRDKGLDTFVDLPTEQIERLVKQVNCYPLAIKWSIGKVAIGKDMENAFKLPLDGTSDVARFCFEDIFGILSDEAKRCLYGVSLFDDPPSGDILSYLMDYDKDTFEYTIRELLLASLLFQQKIIKNNVVVTKYSLLSLTQDYVREKLNKEKDVKSLLSNKFHQLTRLVEQQEKTISLKSHTIWRMNVETQEDWIAVAKVRMAKQFEEVGNLSSADETYKDAERISPNLDYVLISYAQFLTRIENFAEADKRMSQVLEKEPNDYFAWYTWGVLKKKQNKTEEAQEYLEKAIELNPEDINTMLELGRVLTFRGYYSKAEPIFLKALNKELVTQRQKMIIYCHIADNFRRWSESEFKKKNYEKVESYLMSAIENINKGLELEPYNRQTFHIQKKIYLDAGIKLSNFGKKEEAKIYLKEVLKVIKVEGREIIPQRSIQSSAYYHLAHIAYVQSPNKIKDIINYINKGLAIAIDNDIIEQLEKLKRKVEREDNRQYGKVIYINSKKKYGLIESKDTRCIFFPHCLDWHCNNLDDLKNVEVSFIPFFGYKEDDPSRCKATKIRLVEYK